MQGRTFRGQSPDGTWHEGFLIRSPGVKNSRPGEGWYINSEQEPAYAHLVKPFTIGMNTTLTDGNGAPVFEGDILKDDRCGKDVIFAVRYGEYIDYGVGHIGFYAEFSENRKGFVVQDGKILCGRRSDGQGWCGPGGHIEPKETPGVAFRREAKEEFGIDVGNITYLGNCKGKPEEILPVQIYRVNDYAGIPVCDQEEMFTATWFTPEQILAQEVPGGLVFDPFRRSVEEYLEQLGLTLDDFDPSKHKRDEDGKFSSMGNTTSKDESGKENSSKDLNDSPKSC